MKKILLLGNGINRAFKLQSWDNMISELSKDIWGKKLDFEESMPYSFRTTIATQRNHKRLQDFIKEGIDDSISITNPFKSLSQKDTEDIKEMYKDLLRCGFDHILTTNYSYEFEACCNNGNAEKKYIKSKRRYVLDDQKCLENINSKFSENSEIRFPKRENYYRLYTYNEITFSESEKDYLNKIWHIHGEYHNPQTIIMNNSQYTNLITNIGKVTSRSVQLKNKNKDSSDKVSNYHSWVDIFLDAEIFILGFGYAYSEIDLWWLLNRKKKKDEDNFKVHFYQLVTNNNQEDQKKENHLCNIIDLLEVYSVNIARIHVPTADSYVDFYKKAINDIKEKMKS